MKKIQIRGLRWVVASDGYLYLMLWFGFDIFEDGRFEGDLNQKANT